MSISTHQPKYVSPQYEQTVCLNYLKTILYIAHAKVGEVSKKISPKTGSKHVFKADRKMPASKTSRKADFQFASIFQPRKGNHSSTTLPKTSEKEQNLRIQRIQTRSLKGKKGFHLTRKNKESTGLDEDQEIHFRTTYKPENSEESEESRELINKYVLRSEIEVETTREDDARRDKSILEEGAFWKKHTLRQRKSRSGKQHVSKNSKNHAETFKKRTNELNRLRNEKKSFVYF